MRSRSEMFSDAAMSLVSWRQAELERDVALLAAASLQHPRHRIAPVIPFGIQRETLTHQPPPQPFFHKRRRFSADELSLLPTDFSMDSPLYDHLDHGDSNDLRYCFSPIGQYDISFHPSPPPPSPIDSCAPSGSLPGIVSWAQQHEQLLQRARERADERAGKR